MRNILLLVSAVAYKPSSWFLSGSILGNLSAFRLLRAQGFRIQVLDHSGMRCIDVAVDIHARLNLFLWSNDRRCFYIFGGGCDWNHVWIDEMFNFKDGK